MFTYHAVRTMLACTLSATLAVAAPLAADAKPKVKQAPKPLALNTPYVMLYKGLEAPLDTDVPGDEGVSWSSSDPSVAQVDETGVVKGGSLGRCTITAEEGGRTVSCLVETTYKKAYLAVQNSYKDMNTKIRYSLSKRMKKKYRDCSSFVARVYWDNKLGRRLMTIGPKSSRGWALNAAEQARWLKRKGKVVAKKKVPCTQLLPGDVVYTSTGGGINHVSLYIGNGLLMDGTGERGKGSVGTHDYNYYVSTHKVKLIGRPCK